MATLFKTTSGTIINLDNVSRIEDGRAFFACGHKDPVPVSVADEVDICRLFISKNNTPIHDLADDFSRLDDHLSAISQSLHDISETAKKD